MTQASPIKSFFNAAAQQNLPGAAELAREQIRGFNRIKETIDTILKGRGTCTMSVVGNTKTEGLTRPVVRIEFPTGSHLTLCDTGDDFTVTVRSHGPAIPELMVVDSAYSMRIDTHPIHCNGFPEDSIGKSYSKNPRKFTFQSADHETFRYFIVEFAKFQRVFSEPVRQRRTLPPLAQQQHPLSMALVLHQDS